MMPVLVALLTTACGGDSGEDTTTSSPTAAPGTTITTAPTTTTGGGGEDLSSDEEELAAAIAGALLADGAPFAEGEAQCYGESVVANVGIDRLTDLGLTADAVAGGTTPDDIDLADEDVALLVDAMFDCVDVAQLFISGLAGDVEISGPSAQCLADGIDESLLRDFIGATVQDEELDEAAATQMMAAMFGLMADCLTPEELAGITELGE
jgi:hypothetical protein